MAAKEAITITEGIGPYSPAIKSGGRLYVSGQIALKDGALVQDSIEAETRQVMENIKALLDKAGFTFGDVVKTTIYLTNIETFTTVNEVYAGYLSTPYPARATVAVAALPKGARVEIDVIAEA